MRRSPRRMILAAACLWGLSAVGADAHLNARFYRGDVTVSTSWEGVIRLTGKLVIRDMSQMVCLQVGPSAGGK